MAEFNATVIETAGDAILVEPEEGAWERSSADRISISVKDMDIADSLEAGDKVKISYDGSIEETYPAQLGTVYLVEFAG